MFFYLISGSLFWKQSIQTSLLHWTLSHGSAVSSPQRAHFLDMYIWAFGGMSKCVSLTSKISSPGAVNMKSRFSSGVLKIRSLRTRRKLFPVCLLKKEKACLPLIRKIRLPLPALHPRMDCIPSTLHESFSATQTISSS